MEFVELRISPHHIFSQARRIFCISDPDCGFPLFYSNAYLQSILAGGMKNTSYTHITSWPADRWDFIPASVKKAIIPSIVND